jgi:hypothetical protein
MLFILVLCFSLALLVLFLISWKKWCITKLKTCPDRREPKVSDSELVSLSIRKPRFDPRLLHVGFASVK